MPLYIHILNIFVSFISFLHIYVYTHTYTCMCMYMHILCVYIHIQTPGSSSHSMKKSDTVRQASSSSVSGKQQSFLLWACFCTWPPAWTLPSAGVCANVSLCFPLPCTSLRACVSGQEWGWGEQRSRMHGFLPWEEAARPPISWSISTPSSSQEFFPQIQECW